MSRNHHSWPLLTIAGITAAVVIGFAVAALEASKDCLLGFDELCKPADTYSEFDAEVAAAHADLAEASYLTLDGFGADGYTIERGPCV